MGYAQPSVECGGRDGAEVGGVAEVAAVVEAGQVVAPFLPLRETASRRGRLPRVRGDCPGPS